ncbi:hypothetical protein R1flu_017459 [Riccia fluitans]|uniref:Replitron HUH endonuclease domain-containing protein n=1 Tax=Riccia fluitans TaxID=41844 RepID=A0ABD1ZEB0_9MARC
MKCTLLHISKEENKLQEVDLRLSQDVCIYKEVFKNEESCFCGFGKQKHAAESSSKEANCPKTSQTPITQTKTSKPPMVKQQKLEEKTHEPKKRRVPPKQMDVSITIRILEADVSGETFERLAQYINENAMMAIITLEKGDEYLLLHIQGMLSIRTSSIQSLKADLRTVVGWDDNMPIGTSVCIKALKDRGMHIVIGIIGYCLKDENEENFRIYTKNISKQQKEDGQRRHIIYDTSKYKNKVELTPTNVVARAIQYRKYFCKNPILFSFQACIRQMVSLRQYLPSPKWLMVNPICRKCAERLWKANEEPALSNEQNPTKNNETHADIIVNTTANENENGNFSSKDIEELLATKDENAATNAHNQSMTSTADEDEIPIVQIDKAKSRNMEWIYARCNPPSTQKSLIRPPLTGRNIHTIQLDNVTAIDTEIVDR